ncbi:MAG: hypothetical protein WD768_05765 [Phycisphaeraceae bacterium]
MNRQAFMVVGLAAMCAGTFIASAQDESTAPPRRIPEVHFAQIDPPVVAQKDIGIHCVTSNSVTVEKPLECAGFIWYQGRLLIISDRHEHVIFTSAIDIDTLKIAAPLPHVVVPNEQYLLQDGESITLREHKDGSTYAYVMCSLSNDRGEQSLPMRRHFARMKVNMINGQFVAERARVINASSIRESLHKHFDQLGIKPYRTYYEAFTGPEKNTYRWGNIEGITFTPDGKSLVCGLRNPLAGSKAMIAVLQGIDEAFEAEDASLIKVTDLFPIDLGDRGVSDLSWDPVTRGYLIAAAKSNGPKLDKDQPFPPNTLDSALFWWSGSKKEKPRLFAVAPDMKLEAICRLGSSRFIAVGADEGDESEGRLARQSTLTILDFTGFER